MTEDSHDKAVQDFLRLCAKVELESHEAELELLVSVRGLAADLVRSGDLISKWTKDETVHAQLLKIANTSNADLDRQEKRLRDEIAALKGDISG